MVTIIITPTMASMANTMPTPLMVLTTLSLMVPIMHSLMLNPTMLNIQLSTMLNL